jgi:hypothetical protein
MCGAMRAADRMRRLSSDGVSNGIERGV